MSVEKRIDNLIEAGWYVLDSGFDTEAFANWRRCALDCVTVLMEPDHNCAAYFERCVEDTERGNLIL